MIRDISLVLLLAVLAAAAGCGSSGDAVAVEGEATFDGEPIPSGRISLEPADGKGPSAGGPITDGRFSFQAPPGEKIVRITATRETGEFEEVPVLGQAAVTEQYLPDCYNAESTRKITVETSGNAFTFALTSDCE